MNLYNFCKILIENNRTTNMMNKIELFYKNHKLTQEQYNKLSKLLKK